ncbi:MAG: FliM/FliN family flagellar motor switch protein [Puniceicoccales bacterium]|jgi:flagellar motor switch protein FliN|nr:FliM/FliN family flagellar motor switch protein [Puniceicoccales bacterium]
MNPKSKDATPDMAGVGNGKEDESFASTASELSEPSVDDEEASPEEIKDPNSQEKAEENADQMADCKESEQPNEESEADDEAEADEEFPEDAEPTDPAEVAEVEAAAEKITAGGRPIVEKAGQLRREAQFVASQRMVAGNINVGEIEVQLTFDVGDVTLTLKELEGMREGYTLTIDRPVDEAVNIRANGHVIGRGRLVKVEGRLGVQIEELRGSSVNAAAQ